MRALLLVLSLTACTFGVQSFHARNRNQSLTMAFEGVSDPPLSGTADLSARQTDFWAAALLDRPSFDLDFGMSLGVRDTRLQSPTGSLTMLNPKDPHDDGDIYDSYFTSLMVPVVRIDGLGLGIYGRASVGGLGQLLDRNSTSTSEKYTLEAGIEFNLAATKRPDSIYLRVGLLLQTAGVGGEVGVGPFTVAGDTTFYGLSVALGIRKLSR